MAIVFFIVGLCLGAFVGDIAGAIIGALIGGVTGFTITTRQQLNELSKKHTKLESNFTALSQHYERNQFAINGTQEPHAEPEVMAPENDFPDTKVDVVEDEASIQPIPATVANFDSESSTDNISIEAPQPAEEVVAVATTNKETHHRKPNKENPVITYAKKFLFEGNPIVKIASIVLFFGVAFLLKYAAEQDYFPIEWRFISVAAAAIGLLVWGIKLGRSKLQYGLIIQGLAIGVLYLTIYSAASLYSLLAPNVAFGLLLAVSVLGAVLAVRQDAPTLAIIAVVGGFLAPILTSSGSNAYVKLFSYYAVLNLGILFISLFKSWRFLCWLGFAFTFVIGSLWGYQSYRPEFYTNTEPFLIFHFLLYLIIPILFLRKKYAPAQPIILTTVVFGLPTISFLLQLYLVQEIPNGNTYSALGWSVAYFIGSAVIYFLKDKTQPESKNLQISYLAIGLTFFSIFIFFLFDKDITSVLWALEAAGLTWLGLRQKEWLPKVAGLVLITLASLLYLDSYKNFHLEAVFLNSQFFSGLTIVISALVMSYFYSKHNSSKAFNKAFHQISEMALLIFASLFALGLGYQEVYKLPDYSLFAPIFLIYISVLFLCYFLGGRLIGWKNLAITSLAVLPLSITLAVSQFTNNINSSPLDYYGFVAYPLSILTSFFALKFNFQNKNISLVIYQIFGVAIILFTTFMITWTSAHYLANLSTDGDWYPIAFGLVPILILIACYRYSKTLAEDNVRKFPLQLAQYVLLAFGAFWMCVTAFSTLHPNNIPFLPILNPLDITHVLILYAGYKLLSSNGILETIKVGYSQLNYLAYIIVFVFINMLVARSYHHSTGVSFNLQDLLSDPKFLLTLTVLWSLLATLIMFFAKKHQSRTLWITGAALLVAILIKLITLDMADSGTLTRIMSFLIVGGIMLAIGYFVPMPPSDKSNQSKSE